MKFKQILKADITVQLGDSIAQTTENSVVLLKPKGSMDIYAAHVVINPEYIDVGTELIVEYMPSLNRTRTSDWKEIK